MNLETKVEYYALLNRLIELLASQLFDEDSQPILPSIDSDSCIQERLYNLSESNFHESVTVALQIHLANLFEEMILDDKNLLFEELILVLKSDTEIDPINTGFIFNRITGGINTFVDISILLLNFISLNNTEISSLEKATVARNSTKLITKFSRREITDLEWIFSNVEKDVNNLRLGLTTEFIYFNVVCNSIELIKPMTNTLISSTRVGCPVKNPLTRVSSLCVFWEWLVKLIENVEYTELNFK